MVKKILVGEGEVNSFFAGSAEKNAFRNIHGRQVLRFRPQDFRFWSQFFFKVLKAEKLILRKTWLKYDNSVDSVFQP